MKFKKSELLEIIKDNRKKHLDEYYIAINRYRSHVIAILTDKIKNLKAGQPIERQLYWDIPEEHSSEYDTIIKMLELTTNKEIELEECDFRRYILDNWEWTTKFLATNKIYAR